MANFILLCFLERQEYLFIAVKRNEAGDRKKIGKNKKHTKQFTNKQTNQEIKPFEYVNIFTDYYTQKKNNKENINLKSCRYNFV